MGQVLQGCPELNSTTCFLLIFPRMNRIIPIAKPLGSLLSDVIFAGTPLTSYESKEIFIDCFPHR